MTGKEGKWREGLKKWRWGRKEEGEKFSNCQLMGGGKWLFFSNCQLHVGSFILLNL